MTELCLVFDVDDTLYLERDYVRSGFLAADAWVQEHWGLSGLSAFAWPLFESGHRGNIFDEALRLCGGPSSPSVIAELVRVYRSHKPAITLLPDVIKVRDDLRGMAKFAVVTDGPSESQRAKIVALRLNEWTDPIIITDEHGPDYHKPSIKPFQFVAARWRVPAAHSVYVADNPAKDFAGPRALGWTTIRVRREGGLHAHIPSNTDVNLEIVTLSELGGHLEALFGSRPFVAGAAGHLNGRVTLA